MAAYGRIGFVLLISIGIAISISWIAELDPKAAGESGEPMVVFRHGESRAITEETIVDELVSLRLHSDIRRVSVGNRLLEVDLEIDPTGPAARTVKYDIAALAKLGVADADNISRVFVRVLEKKQDAASGKDGTLLLALSAGRSDFTDRELAEWREGNRKATDYFGGKLKITTTERWRTVVGNL
ncbi:hypothetical protein [Paenibacillus thermotolerans]|uniref:hypothetical protein n=1 Tax=Paenibacillus thermotolerans TaxID=3027807 RepID=UPI002367DC3F|nr:MULTISPECIES: hypothetical protein [unclassified Paenibacillus]